MPQVSYQKALEVFDRFSDLQKAPSLHPYYIAADAKRDASLEPVFFVYESNGAFVYHGCHLAKIEGTEYYDIQSPYGYGGLISSSADTAFLTKVWSEYVNWCQENNIMVEFIRFHPLVKNWQYFGGEVFDNRQTVWLDLSKENLLMSYSSRARTAIRKALKNDLQVEWWEKEDFLPVFIDLYHGAMKEINAENMYYFSPDYYQTLFSWDQIKFAVCKMNHDIVGVAVFLVGPGIMEYHLAGANSLGKRLCAHNLLIHAAALYGKRAGCAIMHLGGGTAAGNDNPLLFFKSSFSNLRAEFKIGRNIFLPEKYQCMKEAWEKEHCQPARRVLFYRS
jgi:hypothetical protein